MRESEFSRGPGIVAEVFKTVATVVLFLGLLASFGVGYSLARNTLLSTGQVVGIAVGIAVGAIVWASAFAFFGYVLDLLAEIRDAVDATALSTIGEDDKDGQ